MRSMKANNMATIIHDETGFGDGYLGFLNSVPMSPFSKGSRMHDGYIGLKHVVVYSIIGCALVVHYVPLYREA
jgi:hypothetical protein